MALTDKQLEYYRSYRRNASPKVKEARRQRMLARYHEHREQDLPKMREYSKARYAGDRRLALYEGAKRRAKLDGLPFTITIDDIVIPDVCPVLGIPIIPGGPPNDHHLPSLDKFIPELGYVPGNVTVMSLRANSIKKDTTPEEIQRVTAWMLVRMKTHNAST